MLGAELNKILELCKFFNSICNKLVGVFLLPDHKPKLVVLILLLVQRRFLEKYFQQKNSLPTVFYLLKYQSLDEMSPLILSNHEIIADFRFGFPLKKKS
jgi:hypothetical protein